MHIKSVIKVFKTFKRNEQKDILAILENLLANKSKQKVLEDLYSLTKLEKTNTQFLQLQKQKIKPYYQSIIIEDLSATSQKFLYFILEILNIENAIQEELFISQCSKDKIKYYVSKDKKDDLSDFDLSNLKKEMLFPGFKSLDKQKSTLTIMSQKVYKFFSESQEDGDYGIKILKKNKKTNNIHIFVNGFTNDKKGNNFRKWLEESEELAFKDSCLYGFDWPSGKMNSFLTIVTKAVSSKNIPEFLFNISFSFLSEWKQARNNAEKYSSELGIFIKEEYEKNPNIKIHLYGHSLGSRLIYYALEDLSNTDIRIKEVFFFGGAVDIDEISATDLLRFIHNIYNFYSYNDDILKFMYQGAELSEKPIGLNYIKYKQVKVKIGNLYNFNVSEFIEGHTKYIDNFSILYRRKYRCEEYT